MKSPQGFLFYLPAKIAGTWFPSNEIGKATSIGYIGFEVGSALGFLVPSKILTGPVEAFKNITNGTEKSYPEDWTNATIYGGLIVEKAVQEVTDQLTIQYSVIAALRLEDSHHQVRWSYRNL